MISILLALSAAVSADEAEQIPIAGPGDAGTDLDPETVEKARKMALAGDGEQARALAWHFMGQNRDPLDGLFWLRLSAEFGHCQSQIDWEGQYNSRTGASAEALEAAKQYWRERIAANPACESEAVDHQPEGEQP
ncbi:MAG: hypothetical protein KDI71_06250 [Xanthomonadales bacterium]|nr:hypothetical protein [Xanthomonadales bacterium]